MTGNPRRRAPDRSKQSGSTQDVPVASALPRLAIVDLARGIAIAQMIGFHFIYDLTYFGWLHIQMTEEAGWIAWRSAIVSQFVLIAGLGVGLSDAAGRSSARFWRRWLQIAGAALLVSVVSAWLFGPRLIWFGILHFVAVALLLARPLGARGSLSLAFGAVLLAVGLTVHDARFDPAWVSWIGLVAHKPATEDYVPLLPWFGVVAIGVGLAGIWRRRGFSVPPLLQRLDSAPARGLQWMGRWPLTIYLVHQPILMGVLFAVRSALAT
ncbi:MAG TPA: heparan-alpha-glucosaminide N-acetyltransferase [Burkholderiaceae bacterium]